MAEIVMLPVDRIYPHPDNPRKDVGDVSELAESIKANGILQNLTVVPADEGYTVIIGHRRLAAAKLAGLEKVPCSIVEMSDKEQISTMLTENMQRSDLTVYEQAHGFQMMIDLGNTTDEIAEISGFSKTTVKRRLKMMELDQKTLKKVSDERQLSLSDFDKLSQIDDIKERNKALEEIGTSNFNMTVQYALKKQDIKRMTPPLKKLLKACGAKALAQSDTWSSKYERIGNTCYYWKEWDGKEDIIPKIKDKLFYYLGESYGEISFYKAAKKKPAEKKSQKEIEKQKKLSKAWAEEKELSETTRQLRASFVKSVSLNSKNTATMLRAALESIVFRAVNYEGSDREGLLKLLNCDECGYDSQKRAKNTKTALANLSEADIPKVIYSNFNDDGRLKYSTGYSGEFPKYMENAKLDSLYDWLCSMGYNMSDTEIQLQLGSHPLFNRENEEDSDDA